MTKTKISYRGDLRTECVHEESGAVIETDAPKDNQGQGKMFSPTDLVGAALGSCILTIMGTMANRLGVDLKGATAEVEKIMSPSPRRIARLIVRIRCPHKVSSEFQQKLEAAALSCPVHTSLHPDIQQQIDFLWGL